MEEGTRFTRAIVCPPAGTFARGITTAGLGPPDVARARAQHAAYCAALEAAGLQLTMLPSDEHHPDSTFVEDTAVVTRHGAIVTRPGARSRQGEVATMRGALERLLGAPPARLRSPATLDGGDVCQAGGTFFVGQSGRTDRDGVAQLADWLGGHGYEVRAVPVLPGGPLLHLKSGLAWLGGRRLVVVAELARHPAFEGWDLVEVPDDERYAANCVRVNDVVLVPAGHPVLAARLEALGYEVVPLDVSEFRKMDGGLSCLSLRVP